MPEFLACYDYGTGGIWLYVKAESATKLVERYPALTVIEQAPAWWTPELEYDARTKVADGFWDRWLADLPPNP